MHLFRLRQGMTAVAMVATLAAGCESSSDTEEVDGGTEQDGGHEGHDGGHDDDKTDDDKDDDKSDDKDDDGDDKSDDKDDDKSDDMDDDDKSDDMDDDKDDDGDDKDDEDALPELPAVLSLAGCEDADVSPLCNVTQDEGSFTANCGGVEYTGEIEKSGNFTFTRPDGETEDGAAVSFACEGKLNRGRMVGECTLATAESGDTPASEETCDLTSNPRPLPGVTCVELPAQLTDVVICREGADMDGTTVEAGTCDVVQDGCAFQAVCADGQVIAGSVDQEGVSFDMELVALADAAVAMEGDEPSFAKGDVVEHGCSAALDGTTLMGSCGTGGNRRAGLDNTSVCTIEGASEEPAQCELLVPADGLVFALDSCDELKFGEGAAPGIGEPVCAFQQRNCIWQLQCGRGPALRYTGRLEPGAKKVEWNLPTGTPCEVGFGADGSVSGSCTVAGENACELSDLEPVAGGEECDALIDGPDFSSRGCGGSQGIVCKDALQHGCNFLGICEFSGRYPDSIVAGSIGQTDEGLGQMSFNGMGPFQCEVFEPTEEQITSGDRAENEWIGDCVVPGTDSSCRGEPDEPTEPRDPGGQGFRGLQVFLGQPPVIQE